MTTLPYAVWQVSEDKELKLRLTSLQATKVEEKNRSEPLLKVFMPAEGESFCIAATQGDVALDSRSASEI